MPPQHVEIPFGIEVPVDHSTIMFPGGDEHAGAALEQKHVRVVRMQA